MVKPEQEIWCTVLILSCAVLFVPIQPNNRVNKYYKDLLRLDSAAPSIPSCPVRIPLNRSRRRQLKTHSFLSTSKNLEPERRTELTGPEVGGQELEDGEQGTHGPEEQAQAEKLQNPQQLVQSCSNILLEAAQDCLGTLQEQWEELWTQPWRQRGGCCPWEWNRGPK